MAMSPFRLYPDQHPARALALLLVVLASVLFSLNARAANTTDALSSYKLNSGDVISIRVFGEDDFTRERIRLTDAGTVSFPILGEIPVLGRTLGDIEALITNGLKGRYLVNPRVSVSLVEYRSFFISGMVEKPGAYPFQPGLNVRKAVSIAGGFKERASVNKIYVVRDKDGSHRPIKVDLDAEVDPGDTVTVEESFF
jgi:polysaccharide biosynthesis/export protein VpsN